MVSTANLLRLFVVSAFSSWFSRAFSPFGSVVPSFLFFNDEVPAFTTATSSSEPLVRLRARQKKKKRKGGDASSSSSKKRSVETDPPHVDDKTPPLGRATNIPAADLAGVSEDHRFEQFFYDESSTRRLLKVATSFERPLLVCNPSLAVAAEERGDVDYLLLDRDERFDFLKGYRRFDLAAPHLAPPSFRYDAVFVDPPYANVTPAGLARCLAAVAPDAARARVPVYVGYNSEREDELVSAFREHYAGPPLERKWRLRYRTVPAETEEKIWLYGPVGGEWPC